MSRACVRPVLHKYRSGVSFVAAAVFLAAVATAAVPSQVDELGAERAVARVVDAWIAIAQEQCNRSLYIQAENSLVRAQEYYQYLTEAQREKINALVEKTHKAMLGKKLVLDRLENAEKLAQQGHLIKARSHLEQLAHEPFLSESESRRITLKIGRLDAQINREKRLMADLFRESKKHYEAGDFEKAREGFVEVAGSGLYVPTDGMTAEEYLARINASAVQRVKQPESKPKFNLRFRRQPKEQSSEQQAQKNLMNFAKPEAQIPQQQPPKKEFPKQPHDVKASYIKAVIRDAQDKVAKHLGAAQFGQARAVVEDAQKRLNEFRGDLEPQFYEKCRGQLHDLSTMILVQQESWSGP